MRPRKLAERRPDAMQMGLQCEHPTCFSHILQPTVALFEHGCLVAFAVECPDFSSLAFRPPLASPPFGATLHTIVLQRCRISPTPTARSPSIDRT